MAINSRSKGQRGERMVAESLNVICQRVCLGFGYPIYKLTRNLVQSRNGGHDLVGLDWIAIEVKWYRESQHLEKWWAQAVKQGEAVNAEPVLIWKNNGTKWRVRMWGRLELEPGRRLRVPVDISWETFCAWFEKRLEVELKKKSDDRSFASDAGLFD
jgi:hypothetical protein